MVVQNSEITDTDNEQEPNAVLFVCDNTSDPRKRGRRILAQVCATIAQSLLVLDVGMMVVVPTIVIGELHNAKQGQLSLNDSQSSWFASCMLLCQPLGCLLSSYVQGFMGQKSSMLLTNLPHLVAWYLLYSAQSPNILYAASAIMGVGIGFMEAPTLAYIGEISEPHIRSTLATIVNTHVVIGFLLEFTLGWLLPWRIAMLVSCSVPIIAAITISLIPESPIWLLTKGKKYEAMESLRWLRGCVPFEEVSEEFYRLEQYCQASTNDLKTKRETKIENTVRYTEVPDYEYSTVHGETSIIHRLRDFLRAGMLKPLRLVLLYMFFSHAVMLSAMRPYMIGTFNKLRVPISPTTLTVLTAALQFLGALTCICFVRLTGKRALSLVSMVVCSICCLSLGAYAYAILWYSFSMPWIPLLIFCVLYYFINLGISPVPWLLISEVFPNRGRGTAGSLCAAIFYILAFIMGSTWFSLQNLIELHGCFFFYGILGIFGIVYIFICLPETEGKTLAEIEKLFMKKQ
ncbi:Sugar transporter, conserved site,Major facilitator superfamily domain,Major facilitator, sugar [Cinara cedri]|uniref:Sugar transporter, conserved site,Major facilitator superfamily domain,Major facilitator, sugar n=1 Tax=Cinara cedri TaxID=506608 RepID=A0A5E4N692_9HEMI|nr:Sugar transporter, conserved site,Major facilitator superfamily domain,Major facilitator, sugar [Cinara cedri]